MRESPWRRAAREAIERRLDEGQAKGLAGKELARFVSEGYPFGPRKCHPYRVWLHEFERRVKGVFRPFTTRARRRHLQEVPDGQLWLFDLSREGTASPPPG